MYKQVCHNRNRGRCVNEGDDTVAKRQGKKIDKQEAQRELVERARSLPGVAEVMDVYIRLSPYTQFLNVQPGQVRNATGANGL